MKIKSLNYKTMVIISFFSIAIATISIMSLNHHIQKIDESLVLHSIYQQNELENIKEKIESLFGTSDSLMHQFWISSLENVIPYFVEEVKKPENLNAIITNLKTTQFNFSQAGFSLSILEPCTNKVYSPSGVNSLEKTLENLNFDEKFAHTILEMIPGDNPQCFNNGKNLLLLCKPWSNANMNNRLIEFYIYDLRTLKLDTQRMKGCGLWLNFNDMVVFSLQGVDTPPLSTIMQAPKKYMVSHITSQFFDFSYTIVSPDKTKGFYPSGVYRKVIIILTISLLLFFLIYLLTKLLYKPINLLYSDALNLSLHKKHTTKNELLVVSDTLNYLQNTIENLQETAKGNKTLLREKKIRDLLLGLSKEEDIPEIAQGLNLPIANNKGSIILIGLMDTDILGVYDLARISEIVWTHLNNQLSLFSTIEHEAVLQTLSLRRFCILTAQNNADLLRPVIQNLKKTIQESINLNIAIIIEEILPHETIPEVYNRTLAMLNSKGNQQYNLLTESKQSKDEQSTGLIYSLDTERELIKLVQKNDFQSIQALISHIISQNFKAEISRELLYKAFQITLTRILVNTGITSTFTLFSEASQTLNWVEFQKLAIDDFIRLSQELQSKSKTESADFLQEIITYIDKNYHKNISLTDVADYFQFSTVYMSTLFKSIAGINFKEYLTSVQIKHAKILIEQGEKIYNVSYQVGCSNVDTFIRMFKRVTGLSPGKYQQLHEKNLKKNNQT